MSKKKVPYKIYENIGTIFWFVMDYCWLSNSNEMACILGLFAVTFLGIASANTLFNDECRLSDTFSYAASWLWCISNVYWMVSSTPFGLEKHLETEELGMNLAKIAFLIASIMFLLSFIFSKIEKKEINFKRFKK